MRSSATRMRRRNQSAWNAPRASAFFVVQYFGRPRELDSCRRHHGGEKAVRHGNDEGYLWSSSNVSHLDVRSPGRDVQRQVCAFTGRCVRDGRCVGVAAAIERRQGCRTTVVESNFRQWRGRSLALLAPLPGSDWAACRSATRRLRRIRRYRRSTDNRELRPATAFAHLRAKLHLVGSGDSNFTWSPDAPHGGPSPNG